MIIILLIETFIWKDIPLFNVSQAIVRVWVCIWQVVDTRLKNRLVLSFSSISIERGRSSIKALHYCKMRLKLFKKSKLSPIYDIYPSFSRFKLFMKFPCKQYSQCKIVCEVYGTMQNPLVNDIFQLTSRTWSYLLRIASLVFIMWVSCVLLHYKVLW